MLRFSTLSSQERAELPRREAFMLATVNGIAYPFQSDFRDTLRWAIDKHKDNQVDHIEDYDARSRARHALPVVAYGIGDENIAAYILRNAVTIPHHDQGDIAALHLKTAPFSQMVLWGESLKAWLHYGISDFVVPGHDVKNELQQIIEAWQGFSQKHIKGSYPHYDIAPMLTHHDKDEFMRRYWSRNPSQPLEDNFQHLPSLP